MSFTRLMLVAALTAVLAGHPAEAELFDHISISATPSTYDGPCPASIKLESVIKFEVSFNTQEKFFYRWESNDKTLTDEAVAVSKGRNNRVLETIEITGPVGKTITMPIRLHASWGSMVNSTAPSKSTPYLSMSVNDHYSDPTDVTLTCR
ncbi:MAG TPA: hypothetical protein VH722_12795 [Alphaproteobacteria bacterium]|nr:hypothetical protein [Alphaproteobacteria bacterium]